MRELQISARVRQNLEHGHDVLQRRLRVEVLEGDGNGVEQLLRVTSRLLAHLQLALVHVVQVLAETLETQIALVEQLLAQREVSGAEAGELVAHLVHHRYALRDGGAATQGVVSVEEQDGVDDLLEQMRAMRRVQQQREGRGGQLGLRSGGQQREDARQRDGVHLGVRGRNDSNVKEDLEHLDGAQQQVIEEAHALVLLLLPLVVSTALAPRATATGSEAASRRAPRGTGW